MTWSVRAHKGGGWGMDFVLMSLYLKSGPPERDLNPRKGGHKEGVGTLRQGDSGILLGCPGQGLSSICL